MESKTGGRMESAETIATFPSTVFTDYLGTLDPNGREPGAAELDVVWQALRGALHAELRRRGLWHLSPGLLGVSGWQRWSDPGDARGDDALDELIAEGYSFVFLDRLEGLRAHLRVKANVDGLVFRILRHFISERQRRHDPLGARIFNVLRTTVRAEVDASRLFVVDGDPAIYNQTVLAFQARTPPTEAVSPAACRPLIERWCDDLLPDLVTTRGPGQRKLLARLQEHIRELEREDVPAFLFRALLDPLKGETRRRWRAVFEHAEGETAVETFDEDGAVAVQLVPPDLAVEDRESFHKLVDCVDRKLRERTGDERTSRELAAIWKLLLSWAEADDRSREPPLRGATVPSRRQVARLLDIPRDRLPGLYRALGGILERCRASMARPRYAETGSAVDNPGAQDPGVGARMSMEQRRARLRRATGEAMARTTRSADEARAGAPAPRVGDVYTLPATSEALVEWVVVDDAPHASRVRVVAADALPLVGGVDIDVPAEARGGPLVLRCAHTVDLPRTALDAAFRSRRLERVYVDRVRRRLERLDADPEREADSAELELDPDYQDRVRELTRAARALVDAAADLAPRGVDRPASPVVERSGPAAARLSDLARRAGTKRRERSSHSSRRRWLEALAAVLAVVSIGLAALVLIQNRELRRAGEPFLNPPLREVLFQDEERDPIDAGSVPTDAKQVIFVLTFVRPPLCETFRLEIRGGDRVLWTARALEISAGTKLELVVPRRFLGREPSSLHLFGWCDGEWRPLETRQLLFASR